MTPPPTGNPVARKSGRLRIHVLGGGKGESIVLELPNGERGVVDCYARELRGPDANPTVQLLRSQGVNRLAFVCLTHPHDDHFRGLSHLFDTMPVAEFWRFGSWSREQLASLLVSLGADARRSIFKDERDS